MWIGDVLLAAEPPPDASLVAVIGGVVVAAITTLGLVLTEVLRGRAGRNTAAAPPGPAQPAVELYERTAVLNQRADDNDDRDDVQDHELRDQRNALDSHHSRLTAIERHLTERDDDWRL